MRKFRVKNCYLLIMIIGLLLGCADSEKKIENIIGKMTLDQKLEMIGGYNNFYIRGFPELGIPEIRMADGPVGVRNLGASTSYPASIALAASFDKSLAEKTGKSIGGEARSKDVHIMLGPAMNIHRGPYCGRNFEYLGEDPFLAGRISANYIKGMQGEGVIATAKHYAANYQDFDRHQVSSDMDERTLREIYLPAFKASVKEGNVGAIMTAYNLVNGEHASQNAHLINEILKDEWGFDGLVMSDWTSTYDGIACAKNGLDLEMPSGKLMNPELLKEAIKIGELEESVIDDKIRRILRIYERFGLLENANIANGYVLDTLFVENTALEAARGGIVLLKNENDLLPLKKDKLKKIALIGPNAHPAITGGGGSSFVNPKKDISFLEALKMKMGKDCEIIYEKGIQDDGRLPMEFFNGSGFYFYNDGEKVDGVLAEYYENTELKGEVVKSMKFKTLNQELEQMPLQEDFSTRFTCYFKPEESGTYTLGVSGDDGYRAFINGKKVIEEWRNQAEKAAKNEIKLLAGKEYKIEVEYYQGGGGAVIRMGLKKKSDKDLSPEEYMKKVENIAKDADIAVLCVGFDKDSEGEGSDRTFEMPNRQSELVKKVALANPNTIVILNSGGNIDMEEWINHVPVLLHAWYPGQSGTIALAEIILGEINPSGKLPVSFEKKWEDNATYSSYFDDDGDKKVYFNEGVFLGYRHFDKMGKEALFPFGFGLSFTAFEYSNAIVDKQSFGKADELTVKVDVKNTGKMDGHEIVQLYVGDLESSVPRPVKELKGFEKVFLAKGETKTVEIKLNIDAFSFFSPNLDKWVAEPGEFNIFIGSSSVDIRQEIKLTLED